MADEKKPKKKIESLDELFGALKKKFGKDSPDLVFDLNKKFEVISTGNLMFDFCTGLGGLPKGRIIEIVAMESLGKSSMVYSMAGVVQRSGGIVHILDFEQAIDRNFVERVLGAKIDQKTIVVYQPTCIEEGAEIMDYLVNSSMNIDLLALDSIEAMKPQEMIEGSMGDTFAIGLQARAVSQFFNKLRVGAFKKNFVALSTNQLRTQISKGRFGPQPAGIATGFDPRGDKTTPGGLTPRFLASMRFELKSKGNDKEETTSALGDDVRAFKTKKVQIINVKNKCARPYLSGITHFDVMNDKVLGGWNPVKDAWNTLVFNNIIANSGRKYSFNFGSIDWSFTGSEEAAMEDFAQSEARVNALRQAFKDVTTVDVAKLAKVSAGDYTPSAEALVEGEDKSEEVSSKKVVYSIT